MRRNKEIIILLTLLAGMMLFVLGYVINRRAKNRAAPLPAVPARTAAPIPAGQPAGTGPAPAADPVYLGGANERKTIDFSTGQPVVKDSTEDKAAIDAALKDMAEATKDVTFGPPAKKPAEPAPAPKR